MPTHPEPFSDAEVEAALRALVGDDLARAGQELAAPAPEVAAAHVRRARHAAMGGIADVALLDAARARRAERLGDRRRRLGAAAGWAAAGVLVIGAGSTGLAAAEVLPQPAARVIAFAADAVGLPVPDPVERAAEPEPAPPTTAQPPAVELAAEAPEPDPSIVTTGAAPPSSATSAAAIAPTSTAPRPVASTSTTTPACTNSSSTSTSTSSSSTSSTSTSSTATTSTTTPLAVAPTVTAPPCEPDPGAEGAEASTTTTAPPSTTSTTADPGASADG